MVAGERTSSTEVLIIGAGPGGYVAGIRAGQLGLDVTLVEKDRLGGVCLTRGCIPSKALVTGAELAYSAGHADSMGISANPTVNLEQMVGWKDDIVTQLSSGVDKLCKANGVTVLDGRAELVDENTARIVNEASEGDEEIIEFDHAIIATGSRPIELPGFNFDDDPILDSAQALTLTELPEQLIVIGGGYIGMELSTVFAKLGVEVTVVEMLDSILPGYDDTVCRPVKRRAEDLGIKFQFGQAASDWKPLTNQVRLTTEDENGEQYNYEAEKILVAVGREPVTETSNLEAVGIDLDDRGFIETDSQARTSRDHIFAIGDVAGEPMLAHKGSTEGEVAAAVIAGEDAELDYQAIPAAVFTDPEIATVGLTEAEAVEANVEPVVGQFPFRASGRALTTGHTNGFTRIIADADTGVILGGQIVGTHASDLIAEIGLAIENGLTLTDLIGTIHTHPTLAETIREAAENAVGRAIHTLNR